MEIEKVTETKNTGKNHLATESSPYLLQHQNNPVWWHGWGEEAFLRAKKENKLIFLSIGYSTCHWCHVMEKESFDNGEIAELLNKGFVSIKVDREERPDVDQFHMAAMQAMGINGGWPLSVFLTPDLKPFWGGTYFNKDQFRSILIQLTERWMRHGPEFYKASAKLFNFLATNNPLSKTDYSISEKLLSSAFIALKKNFDTKFGGFGTFPKFPPSVRLRLLMRISRRNAKEKENKLIAEMVEKTLMGMFQGGIYDHLGGGFARYSTDERWLVPHFEKMLYDNANLSFTYIEAFQLTGNPLYGEVAKDILDYVQRDLGHEDGGFYSAEDADSEGEEGRFYVWQYEEIRELLNQEEFEQVKLNYALTAEGNFSNGRNILNLIENHNPRIVFSEELRYIKERLFNFRNRRVRPLRDEKILVGLNGLMITSLAKAFQVFRNEHYLEQAQKTATFIREKFDTNRTLKRRYFRGKVGIDACLEDYAYLIDGLIHLYETDFNSEWLRWALDLQKRQDELLWSEKGAYYSSIAESDLVLRTIDIEDSANPNPNGLSILNLLRFYHFTYNENFLERAIKMLKSIGPAIEKHPMGFAQALIAVDFFIDRAVELAVVGDKNSMEYVEILSYLHKSFLPNKVLALKDIQLPAAMTEWPELLGKKKMMDGKTTTYVCERGTCFKHTSSVLELKRQLSNFQYLNLD